jgi:hypothetical protein
MASVGLAYAQLHDASDSKEAYSAARQALGQAQSATNDPLVLDMIEREFDELPPP